MRNLVTYFLNQSERIFIIIPIVGIVYMGLLYILVVTTFFLASFVDPGIYPRGECVCVCVGGRGCVYVGGGGCVCVGGGGGVCGGTLNTFSVLL